MSHDYSNIAREILEHLGGSDNLEQAAHCVTRLRLALKDPSLVNNSALNQVDLVKGSFFTGGLFQVVIGPGEVEKVYAALREQTGLAAATIADVKKKGADKTNAMQRLVRVFSDVFMPILPALIIGLMAYGTYEFTSYAIMKDWHWQMVATDVIWDTVLTAVSAWVGVTVARMVS